MIRVKNRKSKPLYRRIYLDYLMISIGLISLFGVCFSLVNSKILHQQISKYSQENISQILYNIELNIDEINTTIINLGFNETISTVLTGSKSIYSKHVNYTSIIDLFKTVQDSDPYIESIYLYIQSEDIVISSENTITPLDKFVDHSWVQYIEEDGEFVIKTHPVHRSLTSRETDVVSVGRNLPLFNNKGLYFGTIVININADSLCDTMKEDSENIFVLDNRGMVIASKNKDDLYKRFDWAEEAVIQKKNSLVYKGETKQFIVLKDSETCNWTIASVSDYANIFSTHDILFSLSMLTSFLAILGMIVISSKMTKRTYEPVGKLANMVRKQTTSAEGEYVDDIDLINNQLVNLSNSIKESNQKLQTLLPAARERFLRKLLMAEYDGENEYKEMMKVFETSAPSSGYAVMTLELERARPISGIEDEIHVNINILQYMELIDELLKKRAYNFFIIQMDESHIGLIINVKMVEKEVYESKLYELANMIQSIDNNQLKLIINIGIGKRVLKLSKISESYYQSVQALNLKIFYGKNSVILYTNTNLDQQGEKTNSFYYKQHIVSIINLLKASEIEKCSEKVTEVIEKSNKRDVSTKELKRFIKSLLPAIELNLWEMDIQMSDVTMYKWNQADELLSYYDINEIKVWFESFFEELGLLLGKRRDNIHFESIEKAKNYVYNHYRENIGIGDVADHVFLSASYLGKLFVKIEGISFNKYLQNYRIEKSKELLENTQYKIFEIANMVGVPNNAYFVSVFRKVNGVTPKNIEKTYRRKLCLKI